MAVGTVWTHTPRMFYDPDPVLTLVDRALWGNGWLGRRGPDGRRVASRPGDVGGWRVVGRGVRAMLPAAEGTWAVTVQGMPVVEGAPPVQGLVGWAYVHAAPVRWLRSGGTG